MHQNSACLTSRLRRNTILATAIAPVAATILALPTSTSADAIFVPSDAILGGQLNTGANQFQVGTVGTTGGLNNWPTNESPVSAIDGFGQKYLNFAEFYTGILVRPAFNGGNGTVVTSMQLWAANDAVPRDPSSYELWGSNAALDFGSLSFDMGSFTKISEGGLGLPDSRNLGGTNVLNAANSQTIGFANTQGYKSYIIVFPTVKDSASANSMQIAEIQLFGSAAFTALTWTGSVSNVWNINSATNWDSSGATSTFSDTNGVTFNDTVTAGRSNIVIQAGGAGVKPAVVVFENNSVNYTISGEAIVSPGSLTLTGTGTVTLNNTNSYANGTTVNAGSLIVGSTGSLGTGPLRINNPNTGAGTAVNVTFNSAQVVGALSGTIAAPVTGTNTVGVQLNGDLTVTQTTGGTFAGDIAGAGALIKTGSSILTLTGSSVYTGATTVAAGTLSSSRPGGNAKGALPAGQPVNVNAGATLHFGADEGAGFGTGSVSGITVTGGTVTSAANTHSSLPPITLNGGTVTSEGPGGFVNGTVVNYVLDGDVTTAVNANSSAIRAQAVLLRKDPTNIGATAPVTFDIPRGTAPVDLKIQSAVYDLGAGLTKTGNGILGLGNSSFYTGPTLINGGTILAASSGALGTGPVTIGNGATLALEAATSLSGFAGFNLNGGATVNSSANILTLTENVGSQARSAFTVAPVNFGAGFSTSFVYTASGNRAADGFTFTIQGSSPTAIGGGGGQLGYVGISNSVAVEFNIYTGGGQPVGTTVTAGAAGPYTASSPVNLASGNPIQISITYDPVAATVSEMLTDTVANTTYSNVFTGISYPGFIGSNAGFVGFTGATGGAFAQQTISNFTFSNVSNDLVLQNAINVPAGGNSGIQVQPNAGGTAAAVSLSGIVTVGANGTLNVTSGGTATNAPYTLTLGGNVKLSGNATISVGNNGIGAGKVVAELPIEETAPANLTKAGPGTLTIAGAATYTGTTTVNAGTLMVTGSVSGAATTVTNSAVLAGTGTLTAVTIANGGTLSPGTTGIGTLTTGPLSLQADATLALEIGSTTADQVKLNGAGTIAGNVVLALTLTADPADFQSFTILDGTAALVGYAAGSRFSYLGGNLAEGQVFNVASGGFSQDFMISYLADGGKDVVLTAVPEPAAAAFLLLGLGLSLRRKRRG